jgi:hypothetical protein
MSCIEMPRPASGAEPPRSPPGVFARLRSFAYNILRRNQTSTFNQDRYAAALGGVNALLKWSFN